ncbi:MAG: AraC family transcriptional regulator [Vallitaleaceae bacterium]|jgi:AraC-like DNA-binding protein|nr:AraC family transcriptional regulator [Vallitaleaceae bacterium]
MNQLVEEQTMYFTNLLCETLPDSYKNHDYVNALGIPTKGRFIVLQLVLSNHFNALINKQPENHLSDWKHNFHQLILEHFSTETLNPIALLNLQPFTRTLIIQTHPDLPCRDYGKNTDGKSLANAMGTSLGDAVEKSDCEIFDVLRLAFSSLIDHIKTDYETSVIGCFGDLKNELLDIGVSYKNALRLKEYTYVIGLSECVFFDEAGLTTDYSLVAYKYIHLFDELFEQKNWIDLYDLLDKLRANLIDDFINNSKTIYLYKEIYGITIRHLFKDMALYKNEIQLLNEGINLFDHLYDDIHTVHTSYLAILNTITHEETSYCHPSIKKALKIIHTKYMEHLNLSYLSECLHLSTAYFSRLFKDEMGMNFKEYLTSYRIGIAKSLLTDSSMNIGDIALSIGYTTASQMVRVFKSMEGMTPTVYRQLKKQ